METVLSPASSTWVGEKRGFGVEVVDSQTHVHVDSLNNFIQHTSTRCWGEIQKTILATLASFSLMK